MGRVTVFSIDNCPFCAKSKAFLKNQGVDYYEINLDDYPSKRADMLGLSGRLSVPQIFFNEKHIGGNDDLFALVKSKGFDKLLEVTMAGEDPKDPLLERPDHAPTPKPKPSARKLEEVMIGKKSHGVIDLVVDLRKLGRAFSGAKLISFLESNYNIDSKEESFAVGKRIQELGLIVSVDKSDFGASVSFILSDFESPGLLNGFRQWQDRVDDPMTLIISLKKRLGSVVSKHRDDEGLVDYISVGRDPDFNSFDEASCELQAINLEDMDASTKLAFCINLYNTGITHAYAKSGTPKGTLQRAKFFPSVGYNVGGHFYSFDDIENGILRANRAGAGRRSGPIASNDPRIRMILKDSEVTPLIHTALNCGAKSCPPVKKFSAEAVHEELKIVAKSFFMQKENFRIEGKTVFLSKILKWYGKDFGKDDFAKLETIAQFVSEEEAEELKEMVASRTGQIKYNFYDWSNDSKVSRSSKVGSACSIM